MLHACYFGTYGIDELTLIHCSLDLSNLLPHNPPRFLFETSSDAHLCLLELTDSTPDTAESAVLHLQKASSFFSTSSSTNTPSSSQDWTHLSPDHAVHLLSTQPAALIFQSPLNPSSLSTLCTPSLFSGIVQNAIALPTSPIVPQQLPPFDHPALARAADPELSANPTIASYVSAFSESRVKDRVVWFSTDKQGGSSKITRNSYAIKTGVAGCADSTWRCAHGVVDELVSKIRAIMADYPYAWRVETLPFRADMCPNVRLVVQGRNTTAVVVVGAHLDSRNAASGSSATGAAPGADDNGSGSAVNLEIAQALADRRPSQKFEYSLHVVWFCGEEQGLLGSAALAKEYKAQKTHVVAMLNADMIGYTDSRYGVVMSFDSRSTTAWLTQSCKKFAPVYVPGLKVGDTPGCCSDAQSFYNQGFPAAGIFETPTTNVVYPQYHKSGDTWNDGYINYQQIYLFGKAFFACALEYALP